MTRGRKVENRKVGPPVAVLNRYDAYNRRSARPLALDTASPARGSRSALDSTVEMVCACATGPAGAASDSRRLCTALSLALCLASRPSQL